MNAFANAIHRIIEKAGDIASLLILIIMALVTYEVISRYVFNAPTSWVWLINKQLFGVFVMVSGGYALIKRTAISESRCCMTCSHPRSKTVFGGLPC